MFVSVRLSILRSIKNTFTFDELKITKRKFIHYEKHILLKKKMFDRDLFRESFIEKVKQKLWTHINENPCYR